MKTAIGDIEVVFQTYNAPYPVKNRSFVATRAERVLEGKQLNFLPFLFPIYSLL